MAMLRTKKDMSPQHSSNATMLHAIQKSVQNIIDEGMSRDKKPNNHNSLQTKRKRKSGIHFHRCCWLL